MTDSQSQSKADLRTEMRGTLATMNEDDRHDASTMACERLWQLDSFVHADVVMLYMPLLTEVDLTPAAVRCFQTGKTVCVPKVEWERRDMSAVEVTSFDDHVMEIDEHGLRSPRVSRPILPELIDLVVVPGLAFDTRGNRLGRGGGYFDRFLKRLRQTAVTIGLAFDDQVVESVPMNERDMSVKLIVTDRRVIRRQRPARSRRGGMPS